MVPKVHKLLCRHEKKCIRNNWINDVEKSFTFPDFSDNTLIINAAFSDLINIYHMEKESILKDGYKLTWKRLFLNNIDRLNVKLALKARQIIKLVKIVEHEYRKARTPYKRNKHCPHSYRRHFGTSCEIFTAQHHKLQIVLLGTFQIDTIEARFGQYRMLSGSNYLVSVNEVLPSEKNLKVYSLLKFYNYSHGIIRIKDLFMEFSEPSIGKYDEEFV